MPFYMKHTSSGKILFSSINFCRDCRLIPAVLKLPVHLSLSVQALCNAMTMGARRRGRYTDQTNPSSAPFNPSPSFSSSSSLSSSPILSISPQHSPLSPLLVSLPLSLPVWGGEKMNKPECVHACSVRC